MSNLSENSTNCPICEKVLHSRKTKAGHKTPDRMYWACDAEHSLFFLWCDQSTLCHRCGERNKVLTSKTDANPGRKFSKCTACENFQWV